MPRDELIAEIIRKTGWGFGIAEEVLDALDALGQGPKRVEVLEHELAEAESALWRVYPNTHIVGKPADPFEGPGETYRAAYERMEKRVAELEKEVLNLRTQLELADPALARVLNQAIAEQKPRAALKGQNNG